MNPDLQRRIREHHAATQRKKRRRLWVGLGLVLAFVCGLYFASGVI